jgi:hypothetical protein
LKFLTKDEILAVNDLKTQDVAVPQWGEDVGVHVRSLTALERDAWDKSTYKGKDVELIAYKTRFCAMCIVDDTGNQIFDATNDADVKALGAKGASGIEVVFQAAAQLNGLLKSNVDAIEKESAAPQPSATDSASLGS